MDCEVIVAQIRAGLRSELLKIVQEAIKEIPPHYLRMNMSELMPNTKKRRAQSTLPSETPLPERKAARPMPGNAALQTPRLNPHLPKTPAAARQQTACKRPVRAPKAAGRITQINVGGGHILDITKSPRAVLAEFGSDALKSIRTRLQTLFDLIRE